MGLNVDQLLSMLSVNFSREKFANNDFMQMQSVSITLGVFGIGPRCRPLATSAPRLPLLANPNLFRNPNIVFETIYLSLYGYHQIVVPNDTRVFDT